MTDGRTDFGGGWECSLLGRPSWNGSHSRRLGVGAGQGDGKAPAYGQK